MSSAQFCVMNKDLCLLTRRHCAKGARDWSQWRRAAGQFPRDAALGARMLLIINSLALTRGAARGHAGVFGLCISGGMHFACPIRFLATRMAAAHLFQCDNDQHEPRRSPACLILSNDTQDSGARLGNLSRAAAPRLWRWRMAAIWKPTQHPDGAVGAFKNLAATSELVLSSRAVHFRGEISRATLSRRPARKWSFRQAIVLRMRSGDDRLSFAPVKDTPRHTARVLQKR